MALRSILQAPEFSHNALVQKWLMNYQSGDLYSLLKDHWKLFTLVVFQHPDDPGKEERLAEKFLFRPMEHFLCNGDPDTVFKELKEMDQPSQMCGHVFKNGEPTYSCRDCATDPTCVLCIECFQKSAHKKHRYRMHTSGGGGYCDCGDPEAWKSSAFCDTHQEGQQNDMAENKNPVDLLPDDLSDRASALFMATLKYTVELLTWDQPDVLPTDLKPNGESADRYSCMLFNDEVHTYQQVISTLQKAVNCSHKEAVDFATTVDREGRSQVLDGEYKNCETAREIIQRSTSRHGAKPLKVQVMHWTVVAHQQFALRMIQWLRNIISKSDGLRRLLCILSMQKQEHLEEEQSLMEVLLLADTQLWKIARVQSHQLMMAGVLMDQESKKQFALLFTKHYAQLMKSFCLDDHDHDVSIASLSVQIFTVTSLHYSALMKDFVQDDHYRAVCITSISVQIFTVPTLARILVQDHGLLSVILDTFLTACEEKKNSEGKLCFERNGGQTFKRACFMLHDVKYVLVCKPSPEEWTDPLRSSFLEGFSKFLQLLQLIQGMDPVKRQTGQHLEFEPEWEGAFNLQLKLEDNIALFLDWCGTDREVLIESYNKTLAVYDSCKHIAKAKKECKVAGITTKCIEYSVASQPVSIHLPLTRLLAGLHIHLGKYGLYFESPDCSLVRPDPVDLMELPLRAQVLVAQTQAGMWRRNGYALLNQIFFYHNVKCRTEMYDRDMVILQICASMCDSDHFLIHVLNKYGLLQWVKHEYDVPQGQEDSLRQTVMLVEEFLNLLIIILSERFIPGVGEVTTADTVRREVIQQLCVSEMAHSELAKALPEDANHETGLEEVVNDVAVFKKPPVTTSVGKGKYELKPECYKQYNPYFYHYTKVEKSKSEETQAKRRKEKQESLALPPPEPPRFTAQFSPVLDLLSCDVMIYIMELILTRATATRSRSLSETQIERVLHLIGVALYEQKHAIESGSTTFDFLSKACGQSVAGRKSKDGKDGKNIMTLLESAMNSSHISHDSLRDLLQWTLKFFTEVRQMKNEPVSMDAMSQLPSSQDEKVSAEKKKKAAAAAKTRARIMAKMSSMQKNFIEENKELFDNTSTDLIPRTDSSMDLSDLDSSTFPVAVGHKKSPVGSVAPIRGTCILCQEEQEVTLTGKTMVLTAFVQKSCVMSQCHGNALLKGDAYDPLFMPSDLRTSTHTSSCGHMMHADCWQRFFDAVTARERRRPLRFRQNYSFDIEKMEFLCPLCECISNTVIPILPPLSKLCPDGDTDRAVVQLSFPDWLDGIHKTVHASTITHTRQTDDKEAQEEVIVYQPCPLTAVTKMMSDSVAKNFQLLWSYVHDDASESFTPEMKDMLKKFARDVFSFGLGVEPDDENARVPMMAWNTCAFTIQSIEQILRDEEKPLCGALTSRQQDCLRTLVKFTAVCSQVAVPGLVKGHCVRLLSVLYPDLCEGKAAGSNKCLLDIDMFHFLTSLIMSLPSLHVDEATPQSRCTLPSGGQNDQYALQLVVALCLIQVLLSFDEESCGMEVEGDYEGEALLIIYDKLRSLANVKSERHPLPWQLNVYVRKAMSPFLRCATLLYHNLTGVALPVELQEVRPDEFDYLCRYLGLHTHMSRVLEGQGELFDSLVGKLCKSSLIQEKFSASSHPLVQFPLKINRLVDLPEDYTEIINRVSTFTCPKSDGDDSRAPTMCLVCGQMLCSQSYCCQTEFEGVTMGAATEHAYKCGGGSGIFLRVRECQILLLAGRTKGCFIPPPYIDNYGETDQGLRRGNPLHLCDDSYKHLQKMWMSHAIPETIAHNLESNTNLLTIDWQHL